MNALEIAAAQSRWARRNVGEKMLLFGGLLILAISLPPIPFAPVVFALAIIIAAIARIPMRLYAAMILAPAAFVVVGVTPLFFAITTEGIVIAETGPLHAVAVILRSVAGISCTMAFALTTPMSELLAWAGQHGIPRSMTYVAELIYRMTSSLISTAYAMNQAQARRLGHSSRRKMLSSTADQVAALFVLAFDRARRMQRGLELRADPESQMVVNVKRPRDGKFCLVSLGLLMLLFVAWAAWKRWQGI